jgi:serine/threonine-protein kinase RsbW
MSIEFPSIIDNIRIVESFIDNAKSKLNINDDIYGNIMVSVTESVNNAIVHGNKTDKNKKVILSLDYDESTLKFKVKDEGTGFDYHTVPDPTNPENLEKSSGRGIYLMKHLCDEVNFSDTGNEVEMVFYFDE